MLSENFEWDNRICPLHLYLNNAHVKFYYKNDGVNQGAQVKIYLIFKKLITSDYILHLLKGSNGGGKDDERNLVDPV